MAYNFIAIGKYRYILKIIRLFFKDPSLLYNTKLLKFEQLFFLLSFTNFKTEVFVQGQPKRKTQRNSQASGFAIKLRALPGEFQ
jgi:hypothetical protein